ncbi:MAG: UV DNA damage repair endonuclease UvsE [Anaerolineae bacterium]|jgi:UV DNA damage endonuclease
MTTQPRIGFPVQILGRSDLKTHDSRRWQNEPHLRTSLEYLREIFAYLDQQDIRMYRIVSSLAPYATHPDMPQFHAQVAECAEDLAEVGALARALDLRLSFHPSQYIVLNSKDEDLARRSAADVELQAGLLEAMGLSDEAVVVIHIGGVYGDRSAARKRFAHRYEDLSTVAQRRLVVENDDARFDVQDVLWLHERTGVRAVFDLHHFHLYNRGEMIATEAARAAMATWTGWAARPKIHFSSPRTDWGFRYGSEAEPRLPNWQAHAEFADPFAFAAFYRSVADVAPDVMLEAKAKDVAVQQLRQSLVRYAPDVASIFQLNDKEGN